MTFPGSLEIEHWLKNGKKKKYIAFGVNLEQVLCLYICLRDRPQIF